MLGQAALPSEMIFASSLKEQPVDYASSDGGPLIALPAESASLWFGTDPTPGTPVPEGWEWSGDDDDPVRTDYDRACGKLRAVHMSSYGGVGLLEVGGADALVFLNPTSTTFIDLPDGGVFLRNVTFDSPKAARAAALAAPKWKKTRVTIDLVDGRIFVFDSAYPYPISGKTKNGYPQIVTAKVGKGSYRLFACDYVPEGAGDYELIAYRLKRV